MGKQTLERDGRHTKHDTTSKNYMDSTETENIEKWEQDLGIKLDETQMSGAVYNYASDITTIEANYKCMVRWHLTPEIINKFQPDRSSQCWRNCKQIGTTTHIWWECPEIKDYWKKILRR